MNQSKKDQVSLSNIINSENRSIDSIFEEIETLYGNSPIQESKIIRIGASSGNKILDRKRALVKLLSTNKNAKLEDYKIVTEDGEVSPNISFALALENVMKMLSEDQQNQEQEDNKNKKKLTPEEEQKLRERQIEIARKLRAESEQIQRDSKDREKLQQIARDPRAYAAQHPASVGVIPKEQRGAFIAQPVPTQQQMQQINGQQMTPEQLQQYRMMQQQMQQQQPSSMVKAASTAMGAAQKGYGLFMMGMMVMNMGGLITQGLGWLWDALAGNAFARQGYHKVNSIDIQFSDKSGNLVDNPTLTRFIKNAKSDPILWKCFQNDNPQFQNLKSPDELIPALNKLGNELGTDAAGKFIPGRIKDKDFALTVADGSAKDLGGKSYSQTDYAASPGWLTFANCTQYILGAAAILAVAYVLYRWFKRKVDKKKRQQLAQARNVNVQEITVPMLCEFNESNAVYYSSIEVLDEGLTDWVKKILPTPRNLARWLDGGIAVMNGLSRTTEEGLKDGSINGILGAAANILVGIGNLVLITAKSLLLGISALFGGSK